MARVSWVALLVSCSDRAPSAPANLRVIPSVGPDDVETPVTIEGDFSAARLEIDWSGDSVTHRVQLELGGRSLENIAVLGPGRIEGVVPAAMPHGWMPLAMLDPWTGRTVLERAFCVQSPASAVRRVELSGPASATAGEPISITATALQEDGAVAERFTGQLLSTGTIETSVGPFTAGRWSGTVTPVAAGNVTISARVDLAGDPSADCAPAATGEVSLEVAAGRASALLFTSPPQTVPVGECSAEVVVQVVDGQGNPTTFGLPPSVNLRTPFGLRASASPSCDSGAMSAPIDPTSGRATFFFSGGEPGTYAITASASGLTSAEQSATITPSSPNSELSLHFTGPLTSLVAGECSPAPLTVELQDAAGMATAATQERRINLRSAPATMEFYTDETCSTDAARPVIAAGDSAADFWLRSAPAGVVTVDVGASGIAGDTRSITVSAGPPFKLAFTTGPQTLSPDECSQRVGFETVDAGGNPSPVAMAEEVTFLVFPVAGPSFFSDSACTIPVSSIGLTAGDQSGSFFFSLPSTGSWQIGIDSPNLEEAVQSHVALDGTCGDGRVDVGEACDDGDPIGGDGCTNCTVDGGWSCLRSPSDCHPTLTTAFVDDDCSMGGAGTPSNPYCDIGSAVASTKPAIFVYAGVYQELVVIDTQEVTIIAEEGAHLDSTGIAGDAVLLSGNSNVRIRGLEISGAEDCVEASDASILELDEVRIGPCAEAGVDMEVNSSLQMDRSFVFMSAYGIALDDNTSWQIRNSIIVENASDGMRLLAPQVAPSAIYNVTVANNGDDGVQCVEPVPMTNMIIWGNLATQLEGPCTTSFSNIDQATLGLQNIRLDPHFTADGTYHLEPTSPCIDAGSFISGLERDFDCDPRPLGAGIDMGADEAL